MAQAFGKVWHEALRNKLRQILTGVYLAILDSHISDRAFRVTQNQVHSKLKKRQAGVPHGSVLRPVLYLP